MIRAQATDLLQQMGFDPGQPEVAPAQEVPAGESDETRLSPDQLALFLRSLNSQLSNAIAEVRGSSADLEMLAEEVRKVETFLGKGDWKTEKH